jgi:hypothetical protein
MNPPKTNLITSLFVYVFNEVMRLVWGASFATEVVLLGKLGENEVFCRKRSNTVLVIILLQHYSLITIHSYPGVRLEKNLNPLRCGGLLRIAPLGRKKKNF